MLNQNSPDKLGVGLDSGVVYRAAPGNSRVLLSIGPVSEENQQNYRIQQAVNRYNNVPPPLLRPSTLFKCNLLKTKIAKPVSADSSPVINSSRTKPETRYAAGHFPTVFLGKSFGRPAKRQNVLSHLRADETVLPISRFLDDTNDKYSDLKNTRSVLDVLQDLSRKRMHGKDDNGEITKRRCKGLGGDQVQEGESLYKPLFVTRPKSNLIVRKDQTTQTLATPTASGQEETTTPTDPKWELRKKLALKNNEIFASLSSSIKSAFFSKRKRVDLQVTEKEPHSAKKQKVGKAPKLVEISETPKIVQEEKPVKKMENSRSPPSKDRLMSIYFDLKDAGEVKKNVLETLQKSPGESQFQRSVERPPSPAARESTAALSAVHISDLETPTPPSVKVAPEMTKIAAAKPVEDEALKIPPISEGSPAIDVSFKFLNDPKLGKTMPNMAETTPEISKIASVKENSVISSPSLKLSKSEDKPESVATAPFRFGEPANQVLPKLETAKFAFDPQKSLGDCKNEVKPTNPSATLSTELNISPSVSKPSTGITATVSKTPPLPFIIAQKKSEAPTVPELSQTSSFSELPKFTFNAKPQSETVPSFLLSHKTESTDTSGSASTGYSFNLKPESLKPDLKPVTPAFRFGQTQSDAPGNAMKPAAALHAFTFGTPEPENTADTSSPISFGKTKLEATSTSAPFSFGQTKSVTSTATSAFGQSKLEMPTNPAALSFGQPKPEPSTGFSFGGNQSNPTGPSITFGQIKPTQLAATSTSDASISPGKTSGLASLPSFTFGQNKPPEPKVTSTPSFSFTQTKPSETAAGNASGFPFAQNKPAESTQVFSFGQSASKPFSFGQKIDETKAEEKTQVAPGPVFSFGGATNPVKPVHFASEMAQAADASKTTFAPSIFGQTSQAEVKSTGSGNPSVFMRLGKPNSEIKTDRAKEMFKMPAVTESTPKSVSFSEAKSSSIFPSKPGETVTSSIFGSTLKPTISFGSKPTTAVGETLPKSGFSFTQTATPAFSPTANPVLNPTSTLGPTQAGFNFGAPTTTGSEKISNFSFGATTTTTTPSTKQFELGNAKPFGGSAFGGVIPTPAFGATGATPTFAAVTATATAPPAFGSSTITSSFGSTAAAPLFGSSATTTAPPAFGSTTAAAPAFGTTTAAAPAFGSSTTVTPAFGATTSAPPPYTSSTPLLLGSSTTATAFGSSAPAPVTPAFGATNAAPPSFASSTTPAFSRAPGPAFGTVAPAFGAASTTAFGTPTTAPPAFGTTSTPAFSSNTNAFGASSLPAFGTNSTTANFGAGAFSNTAFGAAADKPAFGTGAPGFTATAPAPAFGAPTPATTPQFGNSGFGSTNNSSGTGFGPSFANTTAASGFSSAPSTAGTLAPFNFGAANAPSSTPNFKFGSNSSQNAPFTFGSSGNSATGFNFSTSTSGGAFQFNSSAGGFNQSGFQPGFGATPPPGPFAAPATFSIGTASTQPRRHARTRRRP